MPLACTTCSNGLAGHENEYRRKAGGRLIETRPKTYSSPGREGAHLHSGKAPGEHLIRRLASYGTLNVLSSPRQ